MSRTTAVTGYGRVFNDAVRCTVIIADDGSYKVRRADGSDAILPVLPTEWRTSDDVVTSVSTTGIAFNMAALPWDAIPVHEHQSHGRKASDRFKTTRTLRQFVLHMTRDAAKTKAIVEGLELTYADEAELAA